MAFGIKMAVFSRDMLRTVLTGICSCNETKKIQDYDVTVPKYKSWWVGGATNLGFNAKDFGMKAEPVGRNVETSLNQDVTLVRTRVTCNMKHDTASPHAIHTYIHT